MGNYPFCKLPCEETCACTIKKVMSNTAVVLVGNIDKVGLIDRLSISTRNEKGLTDVAPKRKTVSTISHPPAFGPFPLECATKSDTSLVNTWFMTSSRKNPIYRVNWYTYSAADDTPKRAEHIQPHFRTPYGRRRKRQNETKPRGLKLSKGRRRTRYRKQKKSVSRKKKLSVS